MSTVAQRSRVPAGVRAGGQFALEARAEADVDLTAPAALEEPDEPRTPRYALLASSVAEAEARITKANRRLERAGITERFTYEVGEPYVSTDENGHDRFYRDLTLSHPTISYNGWEFAAAVDHLETGPIVRSRPGVELNGWRPEVSECDHCGTTRRRSATYLVRHADGTTKQVGSSCMADFLGVKPAGLWALGFDPLEDDEDGWLAGGGGHTDDATPTLEVLATALAVTDGGREYLSRDAAMWQGRPATGDAVRTQLYGAGLRETPQQAAERVHIAEQTQRYLDDGTAAAVLEYARTMDGEGDYATNLRTLAGGEHVTYRHSALLASAVSGWARENERRAVREAKAAAYVPGYLAGVREKVAGHTAVVEKVVYLDGYAYGSTDTLVLMRSETGHTLKWKASGRKDLEAGQKLTLTGGTVKEHGSYRGQDQTVLTRVKYELEPAPVQENA
ncbi:hypothetical protein CHO01_38810 [Cellulomonas hominis]|uniref:Uncharacterized protein n=1 Tax=Cellulomonas hominis TaxID=156981 RepID=A0A511FHN4_9CELL|nr:hypothetical protein [Cellulomonas hominis]MBB5474650.1 hypothetical protein [Cellulomonas hominis]NKY06610.1 hypothetical protein [Cellulomonas hominis]GEL48765.1 hypothetical protein CHO01_38810 [Cellulomonas hominis]